MRGLWAKWREGIVVGTLTAFLLLVLVAVGVLVAVVAVALFGPVVTVLAGLGCGLLFAVVRAAVRD